MKVIFQGDIAIIKQTSIPKGFELDPLKKGQHIITHSETGHHHVIDAERVQVYRSKTDQMELYVNVIEKAALTHLRNYDTHAPITLAPGVYKIRRQREYTPEGWRRVED